jgi:hypothetical protein
MSVELHQMSLGNTSRTFVHFVGLVWGHPRCWYILGGRTSLDAKNSPYECVS